MPRLPVDAKERPIDSSDSSSRKTSTVEGQLAAQPVSLANRMAPLVPWTPSPASTQEWVKRYCHPDTPHSILVGGRQWLPLRLNSPP